MKNFLSYLPELEKKLDYRFKDQQLAILAFTHRSYCNEHPELKLVHNERLEFLGDSVLGLIVASHLYSSFPQMDEGLLSTFRSQLVDASACVSYLKHLNVEEHLLLGKGELLNQGKGRESLLANLFEAIIGAIYLDSSLGAADTFFFTHFTPMVARIISKPLHNWKAELQDYAQKKYKEAPIYELIEESGLEHNRIFKIAVFVAGQKMGEGVGSSKKEAQTMAAQNALQKE